MRFKQYLNESTFETDKSVILDMLKRSNIPSEAIKIDERGCVTILNGGFYMSRRLTRNGRLPFKFKEVRGDFFVDGCNLTSLAGCPSVVHGTFKCDDNPDLKSLKGGPAKVSKKYSARYTGISDLTGIAAFEDIEHSKLDLSGCHNIKDISCFTALQHAIAEIVFPDSQFTSIVDVDAAFPHGFTGDGSLCLNFNHIKEGGIKLLTIPGLKEIWNDHGMLEPFQIINSGFGENTDFDIQMELFDKGFDDYAI